MFNLQVLRKKLFRILFLCMELYMVVHNLSLGGKGEKNNIMLNIPSTNTK